VDFFNPSAQQFWIEQFAYNKFNGTSALYGLWIDMNEPAVFDWHGMSFPPTVMHTRADGSTFLHLDAHNAYGLMMAKTSYEALLKRDSGKQRPFVLTRSTFVGGQKFGAMWLGDNYSTYAEAQSTLS
jgi:alpha-glucosidase (family GH31 glycosyl hydrolase)